MVIIPWCSQDSEVCKRNSEAWDSVSIWSVRCYWVDMLLWLWMVWRQSWQKKHYMIHVYVSMSPYFLVFQEAITGCFVNLWSWIHSWCFVSLSSYLTDEFATRTKVQAEQTIQLIIDNKFVIILIKNPVLHEEASTLIPSTIFCAIMFNMEYLMLFMSVLRSNLQMW